MRIHYPYLPPLTPPVPVNQADANTLAGIAPLWSTPPTLLSRYVFEPVKFLAWVLAIPASDNVFIPGTFTAMSVGFADTTGGVLLSDSQGHVTIYVSGMTELFVGLGQQVTHSTVLGLSNGAVLIQTAYNNVVFDPLTLPQFQVVAGNVTYLNLQDESEGAILDEDGAFIQTVII